MARVIRRGKGKTTKKDNPRKRRNYDPAKFKEAVLAVKENSMSVRKAATYYGVPKSTLSEHATGKREEGARLGRAPHLPSQEENQLAAHCRDRSNKGLGLCIRDVRLAAARCANQTGKPFKCSTQASYKWYQLFKVRNSLTLRSPEATPSFRHQAMNPQRVTEYFVELANIMKEHQFTPSAVWNMDESGLQLTHRPRKIVTGVGTKTVHTRCSGDRRTVTLVAAVNASGRMLNPHFIIQGKTMLSFRSYELQHAPPESAFSVSPSGWINEEICLLWFENFLTAIGPVRPQLLIWDGHKSHVSFELVRRARMHNIIIVLLPSHTSNWLQPLDRSVFKPLKNSWNGEIDDFIKDNGEAPKKENFFQLFSKAWPSACNTETIKSGFKATGICPLNPGAIPSEAYEPSQVEISESIENGQDYSQEVKKAVADRTGLSFPVVLHMSPATQTTTGLGPTPAATQTTAMFAQLPLGFGLTPTATQATAGPGLPPAATQTSASPLAQPPLSPGLPPAATETSATTAGPVMFAQLPLDLGLTPAATQATAGPGLPPAATQTSASPITFAQLPSTQVVTEDGSGISLLEELLQLVVPTEDDNSMQEEVVEPVIQFPSTERTNIFEALMEQSDEPQPGTSTTTTDHRTYKSSFVLTSTGYFNYLKEKEEKKNKKKVKAPRKPRKAASKNSKK